MTHNEFYSLGFIPRTYRGYAYSDLGETEFNILDNWKAEAVFYWYGTGNYEGGGDIIVLKEGKWYVGDMGHCSCYGPESGIERMIQSDYGYSSFEELEQHCSQEQCENLRPLIQLIKDKGYGNSKPEDLMIGLL